MASIRKKCRNVALSLAAPSWAPGPWEECDQSEASSDQSEDSRPQWQPMRGRPRLRSGAERLCDQSWRVITIDTRRLMAHNSEMRDSHEYWVRVLTDIEQSILMSTHRNKCRVSRVLQGRVSGGLVRSRLTPVSSIVCFDFIHPTYLCTCEYHLDLRCGDQRERERNNQSWINSDQSQRN